MSSEEFESSIKKICERKNKRNPTYRLSKIMKPYSNKNVLLEKAECLQNASKSLWEKRKMFDEEMGNSALRRTKLAEDLQVFQQRKAKCQTIIRENDAKRWRALQKFCGDNALCSMKKREKHTLNMELKRAKQTYNSLLAKASDLRKYETYMMAVISSLPKDYIKLVDDVIAGLIMRYNTLYETNTKLRREMEEKSEEVRIAQANLKQLIEDHRILLFSKNSELSELYAHREKMNDIFQGAQQSLIHSHEEMSQQLATFKTIIRSINNLTGKLIRAYEPQYSGQQLHAKVQQMTLLSKCKLMQERTVAIRSVISQLAADTGTLPLSRCCRPELDSGHGNAVAAASVSEFTTLSKVTSLQSDRS